MDTIKITTERNYGIDLLRIISMFMVVILHVLGNGGVLENAQGGGQYAVACFMEAAAYCAVDCYALISGFVCYSEKNKRYKYTRYIELWMQVAFYSVLIFLLFNIFCLGVIEKKGLIRSFFPVTFNQYWYFTAYTGVFLVMPLLNRIVKYLLDKEIINMLFIGLFVFTLYIASAGSIGCDPFRLGYGYSFLWIAILYIVGAYVRKYNLYECFKKKSILLTIVLLLLLAWGSKLGIGKVGMYLLGRKYADSILISYTSPTILGIAILLLFYFAQINLQISIKRSVSFIAPAAFGVYLIHTHPLIFNYILKGRFKQVEEMPLWLIPFVVLGIALVIFVVCIFIDKLRGFLFRLIKLNQLAVYIENKGSKAFQILERKITIFH